MFTRTNVKSWGKEHLGILHYPENEVMGEYDMHGGDSCLLANMAMYRLSFSSLSQPQLT